MSDEEIVAVHSFVWLHYAESSAFLSGFNNTCITGEPDGVGGWSDNGIYNFGPCDTPALPENTSSVATAVHGNTFMTPSGNASAINVSCGSINVDFPGWQKQGYDFGSTVVAWPQTSEIIAMARSLLDLPKVK